MEAVKPTYEDLVRKIDHLRHELEEAKDTIEAIRTGQVDALIVQNENGHELYTLKSADQTYRLFIEKMTEGAVTLNKEGFVLYSNSQFASLVDMPLSKVIGLKFADFLDRNARPQFTSLFEKGWDEDTKGEIALNNNSKTCVQLSLTTLELEDGIFLSVIITDLTTLKAHQKELEEKNKELEKSNQALELSNNDLMQFASVASHDLQEPLRKIQIFLTLFSVETGGDLSLKATTYLEKIKASAERMKQLIIDVLNYSRLSATDMVYEEVDLNTLIHGLLQDYEIMIEEKDAKIHMDGLPCIVVNKGQIRQVFQNIISNALKFSKGDKAPEITITATHVDSLSFDAKPHRGGAYCKISIKDNGIGFEQKYVSNIFALFERLNPKDQYEGSGIGLSIAQKIINKHKGLITARSVEGEGAEFIIVLPVKQ